MRVSPNGMAPSFQVGIMWVRFPPLAPRIIRIVAIIPHCNVGTQIRFLYDAQYWFLTIVLPLGIPQGEQNTKCGDGWRKRHKCL